MAHLIDQNFDLFTLNIETKTADIKIPHAFADMARNLAKQEHDIKNNMDNTQGVGFKVTLIKFVRNAYKTESGSFIGLKDSKDIVDHYYNTVGHQRNIGGTQY